MHKLNILLLFLALSAVTFVGCDSNDDEGGAASGVLGRWLNTDGEEFLNISSDEIIVHFFVDFEGEADNCYERFSIDVVSIDGDDWTIVDIDGGDPDTVRLERVGDDLVVSYGSGDEAGTERYVRSTQTNFTPLCEF